MKDSPKRKSEVIVLNENIGRTFSLALDSVHFVINYDNDLIE